MSVLPFSDCFDYHQFASSENYGEQQMGNVRGISIAAFRDNEEINGVPGFNVVEENVIKRISSVYPEYKIIGIDVQGQSGGIVMQENEIDLVDGPGPLDDPQVIGIRVRSNVKKGSVKVRDKSLVDEGIVLENIGNGNGNFNRHLLEVTTTGCPFAAGTNSKYDPTPQNPHL